MSIVERETKLRANDMLWTVIKSANSWNDDQLDAKLAEWGDLLAMDPGECSGIASFDPATRTFRAQQWVTKDLGLSYDWLTSVLIGWNIKHLRYEDYRVYEHKARDHVNNGLHTAQWIGALRVCAYQQCIPTSTKMAQAAKTFYTDDKLKLVGLYEPGMRHARDAMRHLLLLMTFPTKD